MRESYAEMSERVNESYRSTNNIRKTVKETGVPFDLVWDMTGWKDYFDFYEEEE